MSALYPYYKQNALDIGNTDAVDMNTDTIKAMLVKTAQAFNSAHKYVSDLTGANIIQRSGALTSPTVTNGTFDAADVTFAAVPAGSTVGSVIIYNDTGADATSPLIAFIDKDSGNNSISLATNGSDITVQFDAAGIYDL